MGLCESTEPQVDLLEPDHGFGSGRPTLLKVLLLGDSGVGKTSLIGQYCSKIFVENYKTTIGADFSIQEVEIDNQIVTLQIWDTAGQERFQSLGIAFFRGSDCCILVFDVNNAQSFEHLDKWMNEFLLQAAPSNPENFPFLVIGNKIDIDQPTADSTSPPPEKKRQITKEQAKDWCTTHGGIPYLETSAKTDVNVSRAFLTVAHKAYNNKDKVASSSSS